METSTILLLAIGLSIAWAIFAVLHSFATEIARMHEICKLTQEVNRQRNIYIAQLRGRDEIEEVEVIGEPEMPAEPASLAA